MKQFYILTFFVAFLSTNAQNINFTDPIFKNALINAGPTSPAASVNGEYVVIDTNGDGEIQISEALAIDALIVEQLNITSLEGVQYFTNLKELVCFANNLQVLDLTGLTNLESLTCDQNFLTHLDLAGLPNLEFFSCGNNLLTHLDLTGNPNLKMVYCFRNQLQTLNVTGLSQMTEFMCNTNQLETLDLTGLSSLAVFYCFENLLTALDFTDLQNLNTIQMAVNSLTSLDFSANPLLDVLWADNNNLQYVNIKNGGTSSFVGVLENPDLQHVCIDEEELETIALQLEFLGISSSTYCSFVPGGAYNTVTGNVFFNTDNDGCQANETVQGYMRLKINKDGVESYTILNTAGNYLFYTGIGNHTITPHMENISYYTMLPASAAVNFETIDNSIATRDFCISANGVHPDVAVLIMPNSTARPGFDSDYSVVYQNKGNQVLSGTVSLTYPDAIIDFVSTTVPFNSQTSGAIHWDFTNLKPFESVVIPIKFNTNGPMETPPVNLDDMLNFTVSITPIMGDETPADNTFNLTQYVVGSMDPNDKICLEGDVVSPSEIGKYLHYVINFENIGTAPAENVVVIDMIDADMFNMESFQVISASHPVVTKISGNKVEFIFEGINLEASKLGNVVFKVKSNPTLVTGNSVVNKAEIFFDYNFPIVTNDAITVFQALGINDHSGTTVSIFPNPANDKVEIVSNGIVQSVSVFDVAGRIISNHAFNGKEATLDVSAFAPATYYLKIKTDIGSKTTKLIKE